MQHPDLLRQMFKKAPPELPTHLSSWFVPRTDVSSAKWNITNQIMKLCAHHVAIQLTFLERLDMECSFLSALLLHNPSQIMITI